MRKAWVYLGVLLVVGGCGGSGSSDRQRDTNAAFQFVHAMVDGPALTITLTKTNDSDAVTSVGTLDFQEASSQSQVGQGEYEVKVTYRDPDGSAREELSVTQDFDLDRRDFSTFVLHGSFASPSLTLHTKPIGKIGDNEDEKFELEVYNLASGDSLEVYFDEPQRSLGTPIATVASGNKTAPQLVDEGEFQLRLTSEGETRVRYDSGEFDVPDKVRRGVFITDAYGPDAEARSAFVVTASGAQTYANEAARAGVRAANAVFDESAVQVSIVDSLSSSAIIEQALDFREVSDFAIASPNFVEATATATSDPDVSSRVTVSLDEDRYFTVFAAGSSADDSIVVRTSAVDQRAVATSTNIQFFNALKETDVEDFDRVDLYVLEVGESLSDASPTFSQVRYLNADADTLPATTVDLLVTTAGSQSILAGPVRLTLREKTSLLAFVIESSGGGTPYRLVTHEVP